MHFTGDFSVTFLMFLLTAANPVGVLFILVGIPSPAAAAASSSGSPPLNDRLLVGITLLHEAANDGAVCIDGSPPAYHLHRGFGSGEDNWLLQFEGGAWCNDVVSCLERARTHRGSSLHMNRYESFNGILSNDPSLNPEHCFALGHSSTACNISTSSYEHLDRLNDKMDYIIALAQKVLLRVDRLQGLTAVESPGILGRRPTGEVAPFSAIAASEQQPSLPQHVTNKVVCPGRWNLQAEEGEEASDPPLPAPVSRLPLVEPTRDCWEGQYGVAHRLSGGGSTLQQPRPAEGTSPFSDEQCFPAEKQSSVALAISYEASSGGATNLFWWTSP